MRNRLPCILLALLLAGSPAAAWGPYTNKFICHEAVKFAWGVDTVAECLPVADRAFLADYCETVYSVMGQEYELKCMAAVENSTGEIHPSLMPEEIFQDRENQVDFSRCPIGPIARKWVCGDQSVRPAYEMYGKWVKAAESAQTQCERIYSFCIAAVYYADSESQMHQVKFITNECDKNVEASIDRCIEAGTPDCSSSQNCHFNNQAKGLGNLDYSQKIGESSSTVSRIIMNLTFEALRIKQLPLTPKRGIILFANKADAQAAGGLKAYLAENGVNVIVADAALFDGLKYNSRMMVLGGQNSPEGIGPITASILSQEEEDILLEAGAAKMFVKEGQWTSGQKVIILAGNEAPDTARVCEEQAASVLAQLKEGA